MRSHEYELELEDELEAECEGEGECELEFEGEEEGEEFLGRLGDFARRQWGALNTPGTWQRNLALRAARAAVAQGLPALGSWAGGTVGRAAGGAVGGAIGPAGAPVGEVIGQMAGGAGGRWLGQQAAQRLGQYIPEREFEDEYEMLLNPVRRVYPDAAMAHLGHAASRASSEAEAEAFLGALIPLAAQLIPRLAPVVMRAAPSLIRGVANVGRTLIRSPAARQLIRTVPGIVRGTVGDLARQVSQGRPITPGGAVRTLARQTYRTLGQPARTRATLRQTRALDRRYHQQAGGCACR